MAKDALMTRMKENYESRSRSYLLRRVPVVIRIDGKAFHTYTRGLNKPFDEGLISDMQETTKYLCENIQGAVMGYTQSDEISILLTDYSKITSQAWFDYELQKICSVATSMATAKFNQLRLMRRMISVIDYTEAGQGYVIECDKILTEDSLVRAKLAEFDARAFNVPKEEVANYFLARQRDAVKNSISMLAQSLYSHKELQGKNSNELQEMAFHKGYNWNDLHFSKKRGTTFVKFKERHVNVSGEYYRTSWNIDTEQHKFNEQYIRPLIYVS